LPDDAAKIAAVPYDVVSTDEARALADGNPLSFLRVSRAEIELPPGSNPYAPEVYERATANLEALKKRALVAEDEPCLYLYRLRMGSHEQTGVAGCFSLDDYDADVIKKHERTRRDKEDDRTRHMLALRAQTGPVFLTFRARPESTSRQPTASVTRCGAWRARVATISLPALKSSRRCTSPMVITVRPARRARVPRCGIGK
jgi:uncharacterized protein (DUF1015 family)